MTRVEECTRADTGVGAAIAAGNHTENGTCALLVAAPATKRAQAPSIQDQSAEKNMYPPETSIKNKAIEIKRKTSPSRLIKKVIRPAEVEPLF